MLVSLNEIIVLYCCLYYILGPMDNWAYCEWSITCLYNMYEHSTSTCIITKATWKSDIT